MDDNKNGEWAYLKDPKEVKLEELRKASADDPDAWPEEIEAIKNIKEGKTEMVTQTAEETISELKELEND